MFDEPNMVRGVNHVPKDMMCCARIVEQQHRNANIHEEKEPWKKRKKTKTG